MKFNRRSFIKSTSLLAAGAFLPSNKLLYALQQDSGSIQKLRGNIGIYTERGGTIGWYVSDDVVVVIDSQFPDTATNFMKKLKEKTQRNIDYLINTHHHGDHTAGNYYLGQFADKIIAHEKTVALQKEFYGKGETADKQVYAGITFADEHTIDLGQETIKLRHFWPAHTGGDAIMHFENTNVVHMGDIVFNRVYPYIDFPGGSNLHSWIRYIEKSLDIFDKDTAFIFGHGKTVTGTKDDLVYMKNYMSALLDYVQKQIDAGKSKEEIGNMGPIPGFEDHGSNWDGALKMNLTSAFDELTEG